MVVGKSAVYLSLFVAVMTFIACTYSVLLKWKTYLTPYGKLKNLGSYGLLVLVYSSLLHFSILGSFATYRLSP
jgi:hypothetical protein